MKAAQRTCIGCREVRPKDSLIRLVRGGEGRVRLDTKGTAPGRGAYVCPNEGCLGKALIGRRLSHALRGVSQPPGEAALAILDSWRRR